MKISAIDLHSVAFEAFAALKDRAVRYRGCRETLPLNRSNLAHELRVARALVRFAARNVRCSGARFVSLEGSL